MTTKKTTFRLFTCTACHTAIDPQEGCLCSPSWAPDEERDEGGSQDAS